MGQGLEVVYWMRLERLHHRLLKVEDWIKSSRTPSKGEPTSSPTDMISTASKVLGLLYALGKFITWAGPWLTMAGLMLWGWLKRSVLGWP